MEYRRLPAPQGELAHRGSINWLSRPAILWSNAEMIALTEWITGSTLYTVGRDLYGFLRGRLAPPSPKLQLERMEKWKTGVEEQIRRRRACLIRDDVIVRDFRRARDYPELKSGRQPSFFRVGLIGTYHQGIELGLGVHALVEEKSERSWRIARDDERDHAKIAYLVGYVPWAAIEMIDWDGDEYYPYPHFYCRFRGGEPYERLAFCEKLDLPGGITCYSPIADQQEVRRTSQKFGTSRGVWTS